MNGEVSRRQFVAWSGAAAVVTGVESTPAARAVATLAPRAATLSRTIRIVRATDQLDVTLEFYGVSITGNSIKAEASDAYVRFVFGSQHLAERHFPTGSTVPTDSAAHIAAGPSSVVVRLSGTTTFSLDALLDRAESVGVVGRARTGRPATSETALEIPAGLILSPVSGVRMTGRRTARTVDDVTEVWTARLQRSDGIRPVELYAVNNTNSKDLVARIPDAGERGAIVRNTLDTKANNRLTSSRLWLSSHGATADIRGSWPGRTLSAYRHRIITGRDLYVKTVRSGYLMPFAVPASVVTVSEREFDTDTGGGAVAAMRLRRYVLIDDTAVSTERIGVENKARRLPFVEVSAVVDTTRVIRLQGITDGSGAIPGASFVVDAETGADLIVQYTALDRDGATVTFAMPGVFLDVGRAHDPVVGGSAQRLVATMNGTAHSSKRIVRFDGQSIAFATALTPGSRATARPTDEIEFEWRSSTPATTKKAHEDAGSPAAHLAMRTAVVVDTTMSALRGDVPSPSVVRLHRRWISSGNSPANFDASYLQFEVPQVSAIGDSTTRGVAAVDLRADVLNQVAGFGPDLSAATDLWDPFEGLGDAARIIGGITLEDIVDAVAFLGATPGAEFPGLKVEVEDNTITTQVCFAPSLKSVPSLGFVTNDDTKMSVVATSVLSVNGSTPPSFVTEVSIDDFTLQFLPGAPTPLVDVNFNRVKAVIAGHSGATVTSDISSVTLYGMLEHVADLLASLGLAEPRFDLTKDHIDVGISVSMPNISLGVMTIKGIKVDLGLLIPLGEKPGLVSVDIGTPQDPLRLSLMSFGGTFRLGFDLPFGESAGPSSIVVAASAFWEILKIDLIVVSANVTLDVAATWKLVDDDVTFIGSVSLKGVVQIGGFVELSLTIRGTLTYRSAQKNMVLKGTIIWSVDTPLGRTHGRFRLGSTTIDLGPSGNRGLRGGGVGESLQPAALVSDEVSFGDIHSSSSWSAYCSAFVA